MQKSFDCITKSNKSDENAFCTMFSVDISVALVGRQDITTPPYSSLIFYGDLHNFTVIRLASLYATNGTRARIAMGKPLFVEKKKLLTGKLKCEQKKQIIKSRVWNVALYAAETWTLTKANKQLLDAFEMWTWRRMLKSVGQRK